MKCYDRSAVITHPHYRMKSKENGHISKYDKQFKEETVRVGKRNRIDEGSGATGDSFLHTDRLAQRTAAEWRKGLRRKQTHIRCIIISGVNGIAGAQRNCAVYSG